jgi:hypothetical protein
MRKTMMRFFLLALPACAIMSCKPTLHVSTDYDRSANFSRYKTFSMYYLISSRNVNQLNEDRIWNSIRLELIKKGYAETDKNPDIVVNAVSVLKDKKYLSVSSSSYGYGIGRPYYRGAAGMVSGSGTVQAYDYKNGSLKIQVVDMHSDRLVWEGIGSADLQRQPKNPEQAIQETVSKILERFPQVQSNH